MKDLISIIVINYNQSAYLKKCLDSCLNQTYPNIEVVVIDDGSKDESIALLKEYEKQYSNLHVSYNENHGISYTRNEGILKAKGRYFSFVDSDDYIELDMLEKMEEKFHLDPEIDLVECSFSMDYRFYKLLRAKAKEAILNGMDALHLLMKNTGVNNYPWGKLYKRELFEGILFPVDKKGFEDILTIYRYMARCKKIYTMPHRFYHYVQHGGSYTNRMTLQDVMDMHEAFSSQEKDLNEMFPGQCFSNHENYYRTSLMILYALFFNTNKEEAKDFYLPNFDTKRIWKSLMGVHSFLYHIVAIKCRFKEDRRPWSHHK